MKSSDQDNILAIKLLIPVGGMEITTGTVGGPISLPVLYSNSLYINGLYIGFLLSMWLFSGSGLLFTVQQTLRYEKPYEHTRF